MRLPAPVKLMPTPPNRRRICRPITTLPLEGMIRPLAPPAWVPSRITPAFDASITTPPCCNAGRPLAKLIVAGFAGGNMAGSKVIAVPLVAAVSCARREPAPLSRMLVTTKDRFACHHQPGYLRRAGVERLGGGRETGGNWRRWAGRKCGWRRVGGLADNCQSPLGVRDKSQPGCYTQVLRVSHSVDPRETLRLLHGLVRSMTPTPRFSSAASN